MTRKTYHFVKPIKLFYYLKKLLRQFTRDFSQTDSTRNTILVIVFKNPYSSQKAVLIDLYP